MYKDLQFLKNAYSSRKELIKKQLLYFKTVGKENEERIFAELCFCLLTPQSKAKNCDQAIAKLVETKILFKGSETEIKAYLVGVRFHNNKSRYLVLARKMFTVNGELQLKQKLNEFKTLVELRLWLAESVLGMGLKESVHFLRNIGIYNGFAMLDRHILTNLVKHGVLKQLPKTLNKKTYLAIEKKMQKFSDVIGISMEEIDLLFWSEQTGEVFK